MRISDGSSDVCSSDLPVVLGADDAIAGEVEEDVLELRIEVTKVRAKREAVDRRRRDLGLNALDRRIGRVRGQLDRTEHGIGPRDVALELRIFVDEAREIEEIGRASCRERVCQYV